MTSLARLLTAAVVGVSVSFTLVGVPAADAQVDGIQHRQAIDRLLAALRTIAMVEHFALPTQIRTTAVEAWGFESITLGGDTILAIERHVDVKALREEIVQAHMASLSTEQALEAARFFESEPARRTLAAELAEGLPSTDPLKRANLPRPTPADERALEQFGKTAIGQHLAKVNPAINARALRAVETAADAAIQKYVTAQRLPNTRRK